jgi:hypothetical protein
VIPGILGTLLNKQGENVEIKCLSQTYIDERGNTLNGRTTRKPENSLKFIEFIKEFKKKRLGEYRVNEFVHSKFIIADDTLIMTTSNFTPTQFIYLKHVDIPRFDNMPDESYRGIHCEVGQFIFAKNEELSERYAQRFLETWYDSNTIEAIG